MDNSNIPQTLKPPSERGQFPARLHVLLARNAKIGLVIRRGPSKSVCTMLWDRETDRFDLGQWMRGRIYERRSDLSPDGRHLIYFAMNGRWASGTKGSWTAISRTPYLKAISLYAKGDCWHGGGLFLTNREFWLNDGSGHTELQSASGEVARSADGRPRDYFGGECLTIYYNRLQRDGWVLRDDECNGAALFEKLLPDSWLLRKFACSGFGTTGHGCYWDTHELRHDPTGAVLVFPDWEWADFVDGRIVWASKGQLRAARLGNGKLGAKSMLCDFNDMKFAAIAAPY